MKGGLTMDSLTDREIYKASDAIDKQINDLSKRMTALNTVYGNMLSAMNVKA